MRFGEEQYVTATVRDISERLQVQEQLAQYADKLKRSNEELEQFAYVASHDLKAPLRGVIGFSQLLQRRLAGKLEPETSDYLQHIVAGGQHMQALISDLLLFASIGRTGEPMVAVDCEQVLADVRARLRGIIEERSVQLSHEPLPTVLGTPLELMQLLQNLIGNAIKFQPGERPRVHLSARREEGYWRFAVRDEGIGIPPEQQQRIFKIFQRLHTSDRYEGTGVGLSICQKIVQRHGGRIWAESAPGAGATFYFTLPAVADAATA
jgi:light-regulated signal transduction histidine kinase (bacteriophytochrome)